MGERKDGVGERKDGVRERKDGVRERKDGVRERKIEPKPVGNTHPNPVTSTPLGYNAQSAPKGEVEMEK